MSRLPALRRNELDPHGQAVWDAVTSTRQVDLVGPDGGLIGPFNAWVHAPGIGAHLARLGAKVRFGTSIERRLSEVAIITVGARWHAEFEWWAHARMALDHGVPQAVVDAIGREDDPPFTDDDQRIVHAVARQLATDGRLDDDTHGAAQARLGDEGLVELVSLCGYYTLVSFTLNAFAVPLPAGVDRQWPD